MRGTASLVLGMMFCTMFIKTVRERRMVTPARHGSPSTPRPTGSSSSSPFYWDSMGPKYQACSLETPVCKWNWKILGGYMGDSSSVFQISGLFVVTEMVKF